MTENKNIFNIKNGNICYLENDDSWECPINEIKCIGEYTTDHGPFLDDYFIVFISTKYTYTGSFYAANRYEVMEEISKILNCKLSLVLCGSTEWASNVLYPRDICCKPIYKETEMPPKNLYEKTKVKIFGVNKSWELADYVCEKLK